MTTKPTDPNSATPCIFRLFTPAILAVTAQVGRLRRSRLRDVPNPACQNTARGLALSAKAPHLPEQLLLAFLMLALPVPVQAQFSFATNDAAITITRYTGPGGAVVIPSTINGLPVVAIGTEAFRYCTSLTSVTIPNGVRNIGLLAFHFCGGLTNVSIPYSITNIGGYAFYGCTSLVSVTIPMSVTSIGTGSFAACTRLTAMTVEALNGAYTSLDGVLFDRNQTMLIQFPAGRGGSYAIPNSVTNIGDRAFSGCASLSRVTIPDGVRKIGWYAFSGCASLTSVTIPDGVTYLWSAFYGCTSLASVTIPNTVTNIGDEAFSGCTSLMNVTIPNRVTQIGESAFARCSNLKSVAIPNTVTVLGGSAFAGCSRLAGVTIPNSLTCIPASVFWGCSNLIEVTIPDGPTSIGDCAFRDCTALTNVTLPNSVTDIGWLVFQNCRALTKLILPIRLATIGNMAFCECTSLTTITIPNTVTNIGGGAFNSCYSLASVTIPNSIVCIQDGTFWGCTSLKSVTLPNSVTSIGEAAFYDCISLSSVTIPNGVTSIGSRAFELCEGLTSVTIPSSVTYIGGETFEGCYGLKTFTIPDSVTMIGDGAFAWCTSLTNITVGSLNSAYSSLNGVLFNKNQAVLIQYPGGRTGTYVFPDSVTRIGNSAFAGCSGLTSLTIPASVTCIGNGAFSGCDRLVLAISPRSARPPFAADPFVTEMLQHIQPDLLHSLMAQITGEEPVLVGNQAAVFTDRYTGSASLRQATQFTCEQLQALGLEVRYQDWESPATMWDGPFSDRNVIGVQSGVGRPEEIVVLCAHFDDCSGMYRAPGADDNGSGAAAVLTAARILSQYRFDRTIQFVLFTGEEQIGLGSQAYVAQALEGRSNLVAVLAPDMIGYASSALEPPTTRLFLPELDLGLQGPIGSELEALFTVGLEIETAFTNVVALYGLTNSISCSFARSSVESDALFFFENGYPTLFLTHAQENPRYHTAEDTLSSLNLSYLTAMVQAIVGTAAHLAVPAGRNPVRQPVLAPVVLLPNGTVSVTVTGQAGRLHLIQASADLTNWLTLTNLTLNAATGQFLDSMATNPPQRFYRAILQ